MGLRCLLGHDFGEPETERQRNEEGNEVVVTVREVKTCQTCGETRVVSENKEIKSIEQLRRSAVGDGVDDSPAGSTEGASGTGPSYDEDDQYGPTTPDYGASGAQSPNDRPAPSETGAGQNDPSAPSEAPGDAATGPVQSNDEAGDIADAIQNAEAGRDDRTGTGAPARTADDSDAVVDGAGPAASESGASPEAGADPAAAGDGDPASPGDGAPTRSEDAASPESESEAAADPTGEDAVILDDDGEDAPAESERKQWEETAEPDEIPGQNEPDPETEGDDAVIMDADGSEPTEPAKTEDGYTPWPKQHADDEGYDADVPDDEPAGVDFGGGLTPPADETDAESGTDAEDATSTPVESADAGTARSPVDEVADVGPTAADSAHNGAEERTSRPAPERTVDLERSAREARLEYHCPDCGLTRTVGNSSMRAGDICPECHRGYITERPKQN